MAGFRVSSGRAKASSSAIERLLERRRTDAAVSFEEWFGRAFALGNVGVDNRLDRIDDLGGGKTLADDLADRGALVAGAAERDLVKLLAFALQAQNADVASVMVATGIDAARNFYLKRA